MVDLAKYLIQHNYEVFVAVGAAGERDNWIFSQLIAEKFEKNHLFVVPDLVREINPLKDFLAFFELIKLIKFLNIDIVHLNSSKAGILGSIAGKILNKKVVFTAHGFVFNEQSSFLKKIFYLFLERLASVFRDKIITVSEFDKIEALKYKIIAPEKIVAIHNGLDPELAKNILDKKSAKNFLQKVLQKRGLFAGKNIFDYKIIGSVANFYPVKGLENFIKIAYNIHKKRQDIIFIVFGDDGQRNKLERLIVDLKLSEVVFLPGIVPGAYKYLKCFEVICLTSIKEGFPYILLEALLAGIPIVATKVGGVPEVLKNALSVKLVEVKDIEGLSSAVENILFKEKNEENQLPVEFEMGEMGRKTLQVYESL